jgi:hypothetical protein
MRAEMRRLAGIQIDDMLKARLAQLELESANIQFEIASQGCLTDAVKDFLKRLPQVEAMVPPVKVSDVEALIEGRIVSRITPDPPLKLQSKTDESA